MKMIITCFTQGLYCRYADMDSLTQPKPPPPLPPMRTKPGLSKRPTKPEWIKCPQKPVMALSILCAVLLLTLVIAVPVLLTSKLPNTSGTKIHV